MSPNTAKIRELNDAFRKTLTGGRAFITAGVAALGPEFVKRVVTTVAVFDDFCEANDPWAERDFGAIRVDSNDLFFKIDYYNPTMDGGSEDPADPSKTTRVITLMLTTEY